MKTYPECVDCFKRQGAEAARIAGAGEDLAREVVEEISLVLPGCSMEKSPPEIARKVYGIVEKKTLNGDGYSKLKEKSNRIAKDLYPELREGSKRAKDPLLYAVRLAVAGNVIDYGVPGTFDLGEELRSCFDKEFAVFDYELLKKEIGTAKEVLYVLDNAGEVVFDRLLVEMIPGNVTCAVRGRPVINDATLEDALFAEMDEVADVISSGSDIPGTIPERCTYEFMERYDSADLIISKGQGNFETMADAGRGIFFLFKAKCDVVARHIGCSVGDILLKRS